MIDDEGVVGPADGGFGWETWRNGEAGRLIRPNVILLEVTPKLGELLRSESRRSGSWTEIRVGDGGGNASSAGFLGTRARLGVPVGL